MTRDKDNLTGSIEPSARSNKRSKLRTLATAERLASDAMHQHINELRAIATHPYTSEPVRRYLLAVIDVHKIQLNRLRNLASDDFRESLQARPCWEN